MDLAMSSIRMVNIEGLKSYRHLFTEVKENRLPNKVEQ